MKNLLFIFNPRSGRGELGAYLYDIVQIFVKEDYYVTVYPTQYPEDALHRIPEVAKDYDLVVCGGGDGTLDEVVTGMMHSPVKKPIGYIAAGSTNDFAASLHIPRGMVDAAKVAVSGTPFPCDVGSFNDDIFVYVAAFGLFTDVSYQTNQNMKNILGHVAYLLEGARRLYDIPSYQMTIEVDGETVTDEFVYGMVTNSISVGGMKNLVGSDVSLNDGLFEVMMIKMPKNPLQLSEILRVLTAPPKVDKSSKYIYSWRTDKIRITCEDYVPWTLDGEFGGEHKEVEIIDHCRGITFMVKDPAEVPSELQKLVAEDPE